MPGTRHITAEDLFRFRLVSDAVISPDGRRVVYCVHEVARDSQKRRSHLWIAPTARGQARRFTFGEQSDRLPQWSPDGKLMAFLSTPADGKQDQIHLISPDGGEARCLTELKGQIGSFEWSPDGSQIVFTFQKTDREILEQESDEKKKRLGTLVRRITRVNFLADGIGFVPSERWHIWKVSVATGKTRQLTDSPVWDEAFPRWSPDGRNVLFLSNRAEDPDLDNRSMDLFLIPAGGGEPVIVPAPLGSKETPCFSPDGKWIAYIGHEAPVLYPCKQNDLWVVPVDGTAPAVNLTGQFDIHVSAMVMGDMLVGMPMVTPLWSQDSRTVYFPVAQHGSASVRSISRTGERETLRDVVATKGAVTSFTLDRKQDKAAYIYSDISNPPEVWLFDMKSGHARKLSKLNDRLMDSLELGAVEEIGLKGPDGNDLQAWIMTPPGFDRSKRYPAILQIHGGPQGQYGNCFMHEFHYLAAQGYVVGFCNPRGGTGYGEEHLTCIRQNWGSVDYLDLMAFADYLASQPYVDQDRMGVTGGSYGGFMTNWIIGHTDRFEAAITQRCISNGITIFATSDLNWKFQYQVASGPPWEQWEEYWRQSPMRYVGNVTTPTLIICGERDFRTPLEQAQQLFMALRTLKVDTELLVFPEESHQISAGGRADRRVERLRCISEWFDRYLKEKEHEQ